MNTQQKKSVLNLILSSSLSFSDICSETGFSSDELSEMMLEHIRISSLSDISDITNTAENEKDLYNQLFNNRESDFFHSKPEKELAFYEAVGAGNIPAVKKLFTPLGGEGFGILSDDKIRNLKYHLVITIAMITRYCMNKGMSHEEAYSASDLYIMKADKCKTENEINRIHYEAVIDFTQKMSKSKKKLIYSKHVLNAIEYISNNLHKRILIEDMADFLSLSVPYFSKLFKKETGISFSRFVTERKIEASKDMLILSDLSAVEISSYLAFSSHSYFIKQFKSITGMTPNEYRKKYYR